jgi:hypothetical protein
LLSYAVGERSGHIVQLSALFLFLLSVATVVWLIALGALKWRPNLSPALNRMASVLCEAPLFLLLSCSALFLGYYPYARHIGQYASVLELQEGFGPFFMSVYGFPDFGAFTEIWLMFWPTVSCAAIALLGAGLLWWMRARTRPGHPDAA